ncbi:Alpha-ketoglutarate-dependent sulfonate dioxygenase 2 [Colletotrichum chlorophyti]|uniref:Alpha-ketoglutarate-dependent sulfonate dioxygenase 2 n=1 Tax=Colletotrichum chlorophyti TaxID=708187 RepID=A0A1Q8S404_9PEZI|nr:Alpha-ketoglutarate-dependent sulfonate dioxygenase 2 [Colletotrichum chlorophyti]
MATKPLYPKYLPTRPDGFQRTVDIPYFEAEEPGLRAKGSKGSGFRARAKVENITPRVGAEVRGVQLSQLSRAELDEVALLAAERGVLVFRDQDFADVGFDKQREIVGHYGPLHKHPTMGYPEGTGPEFHVVYADEKALVFISYTYSPSTSGNLRTLLGPHTSYDLWHVDQTFTPNVPSTTFFWVLEQPASGGGDTAFTSLTAAYAALSPAFRRTLRGLRLFHTSASVGEVARLGTERALREAVSTTHPLVIRHPVTGLPSLFVNPTIARRVEGFLPEESDALLGFLHNHIRSLDFSCRVRWEKGSVVVWDQRSVAHSAVPDFRDGERRHMVRIIPYGGRPEPAFPDEYERAGRED